MAHLHLLLALRVRNPANSWFDPGMRHSRKSLIANDSRWAYRVQQPRTKVAEGRDRVLVN